MLLDSANLDALAAAPPPPARPGATLGYFASRRRSSAVGRRFWRFLAENWATFDSFERAQAARMFARFRPDWTRKAFGTRRPRRL